MQERKSIERELTWFELASLVGIPRGYEVDEVKVVGQTIGIKFKSEIKEVQEK